MSITDIPPSDKHPMGGKHVLKRVNKVGKLEKSLWYEDFPSKRECADAAKELEIEFKKTLQARLKPEGSLIETDFKSVALRRIELEGDTNMRGYFDRLIEKVGNKRPCEWRSSYQNTMLYLERTLNERTKKPRSEATLNRYRSVFRMVFNFAVNEGIVVKSPIEIKLDPEEGRDRVWTVQERDKIFEALHTRNSWLRMAVYFSAFNPIRAGDLFGCEKDSNNAFNPGLRRGDFKPLKNWVEFYAHKTKKNKLRPTHLKQIDAEIREYFDSLPGDCPFLFPRIYKDGSWKQVIARRGYREYDAEWEAVLTLAEVESFHWHDLKHCAITYLLDNGYTELALKNCGIQYSSEMIKRYYNFDADKAPVLEGFEKPKTLLKVSNG
jgi:integrase